MEVEISFKLDPVNQRGNRLAKVQATQATINRSEGTRKTNTQEIPRTDVATMGDWRNCYAIKKIWKAAQKTKIPSTGYWNPIQGEKLIYQTMLDLI